MVAKKKKPFPFRNMQHEEHLAKQKKEIERRKRSSSSNASPVYDSGFDVMSGVLTALLMTSESE